MLSLFCLYFFFFFKQKTAYEMRISDWSSDVCSSDLCSAPGKWGTIGQAPVAIRILPAVIVWPEPSSTSCGTATDARSRKNSTLLLPSVAGQRPSSLETSDGTWPRSATRPNPHWETCPHTRRASSTSPAKCDPKPNRFLGTHPP